MVEGQKSLGMYESWAGVMGGVLEAAGVDGFLDNIDTMYEEADTESAEWEALVVAWWSAEKGSRIRTSVLLEICLEKEILLETLGSRSDDSKRSRLGKALKDARGRIIGGFRICSGPNKSSKTREHWLEPLDDVAG
jgi:hypothetical protein